MDAIFLLNEGDRSTYLSNMAQTFGCSYICLWSYLPQPSNFLFSMDGLYQGNTNQQPSSSSSGSVAQRLFDEYRQSLFIAANGQVPGLAFKNNIPYMEIKLTDLQSLASTQLQLQFYKEAGIKTAIFMGCNTGEIELGFSNDSQPNLEMQMRNLFPDDFTRQVIPVQPAAAAGDQNRPSSSSSSLRSLSMDSPEYSPHLFNLPSSSYVSEPPQKPALVRAQVPSPQEQAIQALSQIRRNIQFPTIESEDAAMTKAILAVISSSPSSSSSSLQSQQNLPPNYQLTSQKATAFRSYRSPLAPTTSAARTRKQNMMKRAILFLRNLSLMRNQEQVHGRLPTSTQLHHMISERRRREKLNESFQTLRSLLPPGSKKDKASVLSNTTEYLSALIAQVAELSKRNQILEAQLPRKDTTDQEASGSGSSSSGRLDVRVTHIDESTSESRIVDLQVAIRGECSMLDLVIRLLEFLKGVGNATVLSIEANTRMAPDSSAVNHVVFRLKIEGGEWDESAFQEAVRRVVDDLAR